jgi:hypothetical protein
MGGLGNAAAVGRSIGIDVLPSRWLNALPWPIHVLPPANLFRRPRWVPGRWSVEVPRWVGSGSGVSARWEIDCAVLVSRWFHVLLVPTLGYLRLVPPNEAARAAAVPRIQAARAAADPLIEAARAAADPPSQAARAAAGPCMQAVRAAAGPLIQAARAAAGPLIQAARAAVGRLIQAARAAVGRLIQAAWAAAFVLPLCNFQTL